MTGFWVGGCICLFGTRKRFPVSVTGFVVDVIVLWGLWVLGVWVPGYGGVLVVGAGLVGRV